MRSFNVNEQMSEWHKMWRMIDDINWVIDRHLQLAIIIADTHI